MEEIIQMIQEGFLIRDTFTDRNDFFQKVGRKLEMGEYVKSTFERAIMGREEQFPTGLRVIGGTVAIPHAEGIYVNKEAIVVTIFEKPVSFISMEDGKTELPVRIAFLLLLPEEGKHLLCLQQLADIIRNPNFEQLTQASDKKTFINMLKKLSSER